MERVVVDVEEVGRVPLTEVDWDMAVAAAPSAVCTEDATAQSLQMEPDFAAVGKGAPTSVAGQAVAALKP